MGEVAAYAAALLVSLGRSAILAGMMVSELDALVRVVANRLRPLPAAVDASKQRPGKVRELFGVAVAARQQERQDFAGQRADVPLLRRRAHLIRQAAILDDKLAADFQQARWGDKPGA